MAVIEISAYTEEGWSDAQAGPDRARWYCEHLERGDILILPGFAAVAEDDRRFLTHVRQSASRFTKNISYEYSSGLLRGFARHGTDARELRRVLRDYSDKMRALAIDLLAPYAASLEVDFTSFRPIEERDRKLRGRSRNDLMHVDSFPTRPARGRRILRFFTNVHPREPRVWITGQNFEELASRMALDAGLARCAAGAGGLKHLFKALGRSIGIRHAEPSRYDQFMLRFHDHLKANLQFQRDCPRQRHEFAPGSTWIAFTDIVSHAVLSGQYALEQTFFVPVEAMLAPHKSPLRVLETIAGVAMI